MTTHLPAALLPLLLALTVVSLSLLLPGRLPAGRCAQGLHQLAGRLQGVALPLPRGRLHLAERRLRLLSVAVLQRLCGGLQGALHLARQALRRLHQLRRIGLG